MRRECSYLLENAGVAVADAFLEAVERTSAMLASTPFAGIECRFAAPKIAGVLRFVLGRWLIFYVSTKRGITVYCIVHGSRDLRAYFD